MFWSLFTTAWLALLCATAIGICVRLQVGIPNQVMTDTEGYIAKLGTSQPPDQRVPKVSEEWHNRGVPRCATTPSGGVPWSEVCIGPRCATAEVCHIREVCAMRSVVCELWCAKFPMCLVTDGRCAFAAAPSGSFLCAW